ncbi:MAG TPA: hypothetical protein VK014_03430 [Cyclobacteriaceae bacterium]|nr:hypothetical protein [Cyclobacteriaceae bacterium]
MMNNLLISEDQSKTLLQFLEKHPLEWRYETRKHRILFEGDDDKLVTFRLPISIPSPGAHYHIPDDRCNYILLMVRSGIASVGYFENGVNIDHKVFRAYMVRKKQGMSQIKYLKTKGKSRAGSRVRLADTREFFEDINTRLALYFDDFHIERIGLSCPATLFPFLFKSKIPTPFEKNDPRILKIPKHIQHPTFEALLDTNAYLLQGELQYKEEGELVKQLLQAFATQKKQSQDDSW